MKSRPSSVRYVPKLAAEVDSDDGQDPREFFRQGKQPRKSGRKSLQLCSQIADALSLILAGECRNETLQSLQVVEVRPAPDASQLLVLVAALPGSEDLAPEAVARALHAASGWLRSEVSTAITRKRAPRLVFQFVPQPGQGEEQP